MQTEEVRWKLGGSLLAVEGTGTAAGGEIVHRAFGVITHDSQSAYRMHAFRDGQTLVVDLEVSENDGFVWGFELPGGQGQVRYTMTLTDTGQWQEIGEFSPDGQRWFQNLSMMLDRVDD